MDHPFGSTQNYDEEDADPLARSDELELVNAKTQEDIESLRLQIVKFKQDLFYDIVSTDKSHAASDLGAMMTFHALFLQVIGFWIGLLDSAPVPQPHLKKEADQKMLKKLSNKILITARTSHDARTLVYSLLTQISTQHPFDLGERRQQKQGRE